MSARIKTANSFSGGAFLAAKLPHREQEQPPTRYARSVGMNPMGLGQ